MELDLVERISYFGNSYIPYFIDINNYTKVILMTKYTVIEIFVKKKKIH